METNNKIILKKLKHIERIAYHQQKRIENVDIKDRYDILHESMDIIHKNIKSIQKILINNGK